MAEGASVYRDPRVPEPGNNFGDNDWFPILQTSCLLSCHYPHRFWAPQYSEHIDTGNCARMFHSAVQPNKCPETHILARARCNGVAFFTQWLQCNQSAEHVEGIRSRLFLCTQSTVSPVRTVRTSSSETNF